ncbi:hypothetical protein PR048_023573 [Dryococelus australis]|uniref:Helitron helicase-like domain-containing protein n=1 Tax=Dryococelus australis TaxID=614101 RepID=A0ABQ9GUG8_9NEOP|nr:hypothetical protein PR048_023573 [Dryococelus australis]
MDRKKNLFAMISQLGKPSMFLMLRANEIHWPKLLKMLHKLSDAFTDVSIINPLVDLTRSMHSHLVNEDTVMCCIYFNKMLECVMALLRAKGKMYPFGKYHVVDFFQWIEFQHRGNPHVHILLWLCCEPRELVSESMPNTIQLVTDLCSVSLDDMPGDQYNYQVHRDSCTCTKRGETACSFNIPYCPMSETQVLLPMPKEDSWCSGYQIKAAKLPSYSKKNITIALVRGCLILASSKMSIGSGDIVYIPTVWPHERQKACKHKAVMDRHKGQQCITLCVPFRCEAVDIIDSNTFMDTCDTREGEIMEKRKQYKSEIDTERVVEELRQLCEQFNDEDPLGAHNQREEFVKIIVQQGGIDNADDFDAAAMVIAMYAVHQRLNAIAKAEFCSMMHSTNLRQLELLLEAIHQ